MADEQEKSLAPTANQIDIERSTNSPEEYFTPPRRNLCIKCCGCAAAASLILVVIVLILMLTVFHVKDPVMRLNAVKINGAASLSGDTNSAHGHNLTLEADVSVKNPNAASFKFNSTTYLHYDGSVVGEVWSPAGFVGPRKTVEMSVRVDFRADKVVEGKRFSSDLSEGKLGFSSYTRISGKVKITSVIKKSLVVSMNCSMNLNMRRQAIEDRNCRTSVSS